MTGAVVTGRKGGVFMAFEVTGKAAHSGGNFEKGISAIGEIAHKIVALHALTGLRPGITVNVGLVSGGQSVNTTAPLAQGQIDLRYVKREDRAVALAAIEEIIAKNYVPGTSARLEIRGEFLPLNAGEAAADLFATYQAAAAQAGLQVEGEFTGGCADSGFTAAVGCPTLCATGPVGANAHTPEEVLELDSVVPRAQAAALTQQARAGLFPTLTGNLGTTRGQNAIAGAARAPGPTTTDTVSMSASWEADLWGRLSGAVESNATTLPEIIQEMLLTTTSERQGRMIDHDSAASMEKKKQEGYLKIPSCDTFSNQKYD